MVLKKAGGRDSLYDDLKQKRHNNHVFDAILVDGAIFLKDRLHGAKTKRGVGGGAGMIRMTWIRVEGVGVLRSFLLIFLPSFVSPSFFPSFPYFFLPWHSFLPSRVLHSFLLIFLPSFLASFFLLPCFLPSFLSSFLPFSWHSFLPCGVLISFLFIFLPSCLASFFSPSFLPPFFLPAFLPSFLASLPSKGPPQQKKKKDRKNTPSFLIQQMHCTITEKRIAAVAAVCGSGVLSLVATC